MHPVDPLVEFGVCNSGRSCSAAEATLESSRINGFIVGVADDGCCWPLDNIACRAKWRYASFRLFV